MENLKEYTKTELLHFINDVKAQHEKKKDEMRNLLDQVNELDSLIEKKTSDLDSIENMYVKLMEEYTGRE